MSLLRWLLLGALLASGWVTCGRAEAAGRVALVIGNSAYSMGGTLANPENDSRLMADALRRAKFTSIQARTNLGQTEFRRALRDFQNAAEGADVALIYYAGHGLEVNGQNWLLPTDAHLASERDLNYEAVPLTLVMEAVQGAQWRVVILDACRNNPFGRSWRSGSRAMLSRGLAELQVDDVLVLYAAAPGTTASDGTGANSPFARALARRLPQPGIPIQLLGGVVRDDVLRATAGRQRPFISASITGEPYFLNAAAASAKSAGRRTSLPDQVSLSNDPPEPTARSVPFIEAPATFLGNFFGGVSRVVRRVGVGPIDFYVFVAFAALVGAGVCAAAFSDWSQPYGADEWSKSFAGFLASAGGSYLLVSLALAGYRALDAGAWYISAWKHLVAPVAGGCFGALVGVAFALAARWFVD